MQEASKHTNKPLKGTNKIRPYETEEITWSVGELSGKTTEEHPSLAEKMVKMGKAEYADGRTLEDVTAAKTTKGGKK